MSAVQAFWRSQNLGAGGIHFRRACKRNGALTKGGALRGAGRNARLAAKLTGYKIDIKPVSAADEMEEDEAELSDDDLIAGDEDDLFQDDEPQEELQDGVQDGEDAE